MVSSARNDGFNLMLGRRAQVTTNIFVGQDLLRQSKAVGKLVCVPPALSGQLYVNL